MRFIALVRRLGGGRRLEGVRKIVLQIWRKYVWPINLVMLRLTAKSRWASTLYYASVSPAFRREHQAVLSGRVRYYDEQRSGRSTIFMLRRNIHRIEKGLIMRPRRPIFATDYIEETTAGLRLLTDGAQCSSSPEEIRWAKDVLHNYFQVVGRHPAIDVVRSEFDKLKDSLGDAPELVPYQRDLESAPPVKFEDLHALALRRRSVRWFTQKPVPRDLIDRALLVAAQSPTACNRQPYQFRIFDDPNRAKRIAAIPMGTSGFSDNIPVVAVLVGDQSAYYHERDRHVIYIDASLAAMSFILALETLGLSSCCINWPDIEA